MASTENRKFAISILDLPRNNDAVKLKWKYVLETNYKQIEKKLEEKGMQLFQSYNTKQPFMVTSPSKDESKMTANIFDVMNDQSSNIEAVEMSPQNTAASVKKGVILYRNEVPEKAWLVGPNDVIKRILPIVPGVTPTASANDRSSNSCSDNNDIDDSWETLQLKQIELTEEEQAKITLYGVLDSNNLKNRLVINKGRDPFNVTLSYENIRGNENIVADLRDEFHKHKIFYHSLQMRPPEIAFIRTDNNRTIINDKLNANSYEHPGCAWYISEHCVSIYCKHEPTLKMGILKLKELVKMDWLRISPRYLNSSEGKEMMTDLMNKFEGSVTILQTESKSELHFIALTDTIRQFKDTLARIFASKSISIPSAKRMYFENHLSKSISSMEEEFCVDIFEEESNGILKCLVIGSQSSLNIVWPKLTKLVDLIATVNRCYFVGGELEAIKATIETVSNKSCIVVDQVARKRGNEVDLRNEISCSRWILPNGNDIKLVNADSSWIQKGNIELRVAESILDDKDDEFAFNGERPHITLYVPKWKDGSDNEKERLNYSFDGLFGQNDLYKKGFPIVMCTEELTKLCWTPKKFTSQLLLSLDRNKVSTQVVMLEPSLESYTTLVDAFQKYAYYIRDRRMVQVEVKAGVLANQKCDVIVNSTSTDLKLKQGAVSATILNAAGDAIQHECDEVMRARAHRIIKPDEVIVTKGYNLACKHVFHGALPHYWSEKIFESFVTSCLLKAEEFKSSSVAFPPIGTGQLRYPIKGVAHVMLDRVRRHKKMVCNGSLEEVIFVIYDKDKTTLEIFQKEMETQKLDFEKKESKEKCPNCNIIKLTVTALRDDISKSFNEIESTLKTKSDFKKTMLRAPEIQQMTRTDDADFPAEDAESLQRIDVTKTEGEKRDNTDELPLRPTEPGHESMVDLELLFGSDSTSPFEIFKTILKKHNVDDTCLRWCQYVPMTAKLKFSTEEDADRFIRIAHSEKNVKATKQNPEAIINIRAEINKGLNQYFENENNVFEVEKESGVRVSQTATGIFLQGSLSEIITARIILMAWKTEPERLHRRSKSYTDLINTSSTSIGSTLSLQSRKNEDQINPGKKSSNISDVSKYEDEGFLESEKNRAENFTAGTERAVFVEDNGNMRIYCKPCSSASAVSTSTGNRECSEHSTSYLGGKKRHSGVNGAEGGTNNGWSNVEKGYHPTDTKIMRFPVVTSNSLVVSLKDGLKVFVYQGDMRYLGVDCIVNSSNERMEHTSGLAAVISEEAGKAMRKECCAFIKKNNKLTKFCPCVTTAGHLSHYRCIIHSCSPVWGKRTSREDFSVGLENVIKGALQEAVKRGFTSVAIPAMGSGKRGAPQEICFPSYITGVLEFWKNENEKRKFEVHFVDRDEEVVERIAAASIANIPLHQQNEKIKEKIKKIPKRLREKFRRVVGGDDKEIKMQLFQFANHVTVMICDGALLSAPNHKHIQELKTLDKTAVVLTENDFFRGDSRSSSTCLKRGGDVFLRNYEAVKQTKRTIGYVYTTEGDAHIKFDILMYAILPSVSKEVDSCDSHTQQTIFTKIRESSENALKQADQLRVSHLVMPVLGEDMYDVGHEWFLEICVADMLDCLRAYAESRTATHSIVVHIPTNKNDGLRKLISANFGRPTGRYKSTVAAARKGERK